MRNLGAKMDLINLLIGNTKLKMISSKIDAERNGMSIQLTGYMFKMEITRLRWMLSQVKTFIYGDWYFYLVRN